MNEQEIFDRARAMSTEERSEFLERACGHDPCLRAEVAALLRAHDDSNGFLVRPPNR